MENVDAICTLNTIGSSIPFSISTINEAWIVLPGGLLLAFTLNVFLIRQVHYSFYQVKVLQLALDLVSVSEWYFITLIIIQEVYYPIILKG